jgi:hypothetical protein
MALLIGFEEWNRFLQAIPSSLVLVLFHNTAQIGTTGYMRTCALLVIKFIHLSGMETLVFRTSES